MCIAIMEIRVPLDSGQHIQKALPTQSRSTAIGKTR
jgi:hypothetical protein